MKFQNEKNFEVHKLIPVNIIAPISGFYNNMRAVQKGYILKSEFHIITKKQQKKKIIKFNKNNNIAAVFLLFLELTDKTGYYSLQFPNSNKHYTTLNVHYYI